LLAPQSGLALHSLILLQLLELLLLLSLQQVSQLPVDLRHLLWRLLLLTKHFTFCSRP
jgi:hypothetical protein